MTVAFRVDQDRWIPVRYTDDTDTRLVGFRDLFTDAHHICLIGGPGWTPLALSALHRILTALTTRVTSLDSPGTRADWDRRWATVAHAGQFDPDAVTAYFDSYADRWDVWDANRPWLQDPRLLTETNGEIKDLNQLVASEPGDQGPLLLGASHAAHPVVLPTAQALPHFLSTLYYHPGGQITTRTAGEVKNSYSARGFARGTVSLHPTGQTVFATLMAHLIYPNRPEIPTGPGLDLAPWEVPGLHDPAAAFPPLNGVVELLTRRTKRSYLLHRPDPGSLTVTGVLRAPAYLTRPAQDPVTKTRDADDAARDPYIPYGPSKSGLWRSFPGNMDREPWQDLDSFLALDPPTSHDGFYAPLILTDNAHAWTVLGPITITVHAADQVPSEDKEKGSYTGAAPVRGLVTQPELWPAITDTVSAFNNAHNTLTQELKSLLTQVTGRATAAGVNNTRASSTYWDMALTQFETHFDDYLTGRAGSTDAHSVALAAYDHATRDLARDLRHISTITARRKKLSQALTKEKKPA